MKNKSKFCFVCLFLITEVSINACIFSLVSSIISFVAASAVNNLKMLSDSDLLLPHLNFLIFSKIFRIYPFQQQNNVKHKLCQNTTAHHNSTFKHCNYSAFCSVPLLQCFNCVPLFCAPAFLVL